jgi:outer membrane lipoprotein SlyB
LPYPSPILLALALALAACGSRYSPDSYATRAVQQANKVEKGTVVGRRQVKVSAEGSTGAATGAAAGGVVGAAAPAAGGVMSALGGVGGALVGGLVGTAAEHTVVDTRAYEYVVHTAKGELLSVTQMDTTPLAIGQNVLVIAGNQARVVPDYTFEPTVAAAARAETPRAPAPPSQAAPSAAAARPPTSDAVAPAPAPVETPASLPPVTGAPLEPAAEALDAAAAAAAR